MWILMRRNVAKKRDEHLHSRGLRRHNVPFCIANVDALGRPQTKSVRGVQQLSRIGLALRQGVPAHDHASALEQRKLLEKRLGEPHGHICDEYTAGAPALEPL